MTVETFVGVDLGTCTDAGVTPDTVQTGKARRKGRSGLGDGVEVQEVDLLPFYSVGGTG